MNTTAVNTLLQLNKPDGTPFAGGSVNVGIYQLEDGDLGNEPSAAYLTDKDGNTNYGQKTVVTLDSKGQATVVLASNAVNDNAEPIVWIDQNFGENYQVEDLKQENRFQII